MAEPLPHLISILKQQGVFEIYLPFLLTFAIFYGLLRKMNLFGSDATANKIVALISGVAAAYVMIFSPVAGPISQFFAKFFTQASVTLVVLLVLAMITAMFLWSPFMKPDQKWDLKNYLPFAILVGFLLVIAMFVSSGGIDLFGRIIPPGINISGEDLALIFLVLITIGIIVFLVRGESEGSDARGHV